MRTFYLLLLTIAVAAGVALAAVTANDRRPARKVPLPSLAGVRVETPEHRLVDAAPAGGGAVLVISTGCQHCHATLRRLAAAARDSLPGLYVVAVEGAVPARRLLNEIGLRAVALGPSDRERFMAGLRIGAVPFLIRVGADGRVRGATVGALSTEEAAALVAELRARAKSPASGS